MLCLPRSLGCLQYDPAAQVPTYEDTMAWNQCGIINVLKGVYVGLGGSDLALQFEIKESGPGEYTFESK